MIKSLLRKQALARRNALIGEEIVLLNQKLLAQFKNLDLSKFKSIHIFLPIEAKNEPNTFLLIDFLERFYPNIEIVVPKADFEKNVMSHYTFAGKDDLLNNHYHIPEPQNASLFLGVPDMVVVPLLAFDARGYRVGYGKGFYDRFLTGIDTLKVGYSFFDVSDEINDVHLSDVKLDLCITPDKIYDFNKEQHQK